MTIHIRRSVPLLMVNLAVAMYFSLSFSPRGIALGPYRIDLDVYRIGSQVWLHGGKLYGPLPATQAGVRLPFSYPPFAAVLLSPLALVPMTAAVIALTLVTMILTALVMRLFLRSGGQRAAGPASVCWLLPFALLLEPVRNTLLYGQVNVLLMALVAVDCLARPPRRTRGWLTGIAAAIKLTPAVFVLFFLLRGDRRAAMTAGLSFLICTGAGFAVAGQDSVSYWTCVIFQPSRPGAPWYTANQSITGVIARTGLNPHSPGGTALWLGLSATVVMVACLGMRRALAAAQPAWALLLNAFAGLLISPISWSHHWVWGEMAVLMLATTRFGQARRWCLTLAAAGAAMFAISPQWLLPNGGNRELHWAIWQQIIGSSYVIYAVILLTGAAFFRRGRSLKAGAERCELVEEIPRLGDEKAAGVLERPEPLPAP
jgi:alpha-1,2-mannosyltransferase